MSDSTLTDLATRLERERAEADRRYNDALTALDQALLPPERLPPTPGAVDDEKLAEVNQQFKVAEAFGRADGWLGRRLSAMVWNLVGPALQRQQRFNAAVTEHLNRNGGADRAARVALSALLDATRRHLDGLAAFHARLIQYVQQITPFVETKDRAVGGDEFRAQLTLLNERTLALKREVDRWAAQPAGQASPTPPGPEVPRSDRDAFKYLGFEDRFRGSRDVIRARVRDYVAIFAGATEVLDVGCGRGEFLELLAEAGVAARGVDGNERMVSVCRELGLRVEQADALSYVRSQPDGSLGGLIAVQVVEHFQPDYLTAFLEAAFHALRPGAALVLETINPACWLAFFETYLRDLTHAKPLHPDTLQFLVEASGFQQVGIQYRSPVRDEDRLPRIDPAATDASTRAVAVAVNAHAEALNARLFSAMDYALTARR